MKKYKLIKEYPGSVPIGSIVNNGIFSQYKHKSGYFETLNCSNYLEYWEEIKEKEYEILSFIKKTTIYYKHPEVGYTEVKGEYLGWLNENNYHENNFEIYSVKRLSDQEIFTIDDSINQTLVIEGFTLVNDEIKINLSSIFKDIIVDLNSISKTKQKLFTTKDGVDIYEGDIFYLVMSNFAIVKINTKVINSKEMYDNTFSTKEKAEEYIILNKPCLSYKEIFEIWKKDINLYCNITGDIYNLVKQKLNL